MRLRGLAVVATALAVATLAHAADPKPTADASTDWNRFTAAKYLDARQEWWMNWPKAQRDHDTACVSCHTALPYAIGRSTLHSGPNSATLSPQEQKMIGYVTKRVTLWQEVKPYYLTAERGPRKDEESRGTESVLNALVLSRYDQPSGRLREITKEALANMWALQIKSGAEAGSWDWINFKGAPWESDDSHYWGATMGAVVLGLTPKSYRNEPEVKQHVAALHEYLTRDYDKQILMNRVSALWASVYLPGLLTNEQRKSLIADIKAQQQADGGWTTSALGSWKRKDNTALDTASDGYATGLIVYVLHEASVPGTAEEVQRGKQWLIANQKSDGHWDATSLNKERPATADPYKFMSDAATAYPSWRSTRSRNSSRST